MLVTNHVLSGALIGSLSRRPAAAFAAGVASHFVLDAVPHWGEWESYSRFLRVAVPDGLVGLAAIGLLTAAAPPSRRLAVMAGMAGAALPDIDKPSRLWFGRSPFPAAVDRFHSGIQNEAPGRARRELAAAGWFAAAALAVLRVSASREAARPALMTRSARLTRSARRKSPQEAGGMGHDGLVLASVKRRWGSPRPVLPGEPRR